MVARRKRSARNRNVVYSGKVGAKMRQPKHRINARRARILKSPFALKGGPLDGARVLLDRDAGAPWCTLALAPMRGFGAGRYINAVWTPEGPQP